MRKFLALLMVAVFALAAAAGCTASKKPMPGNPNNPDQTGRNLTNTRDTRDMTDRNNNTRNNMNTRNNRNANNGGTGDTRIIGSTNANRSEADKLSARLSKIQGVDKAYVVVMGNTALIGLNLKDKIGADQAKKIKDEAANKAEDRKRIVKAYVTSDPDLVQRIQKVAKGITSGRPITDFFEEIRTILDRLKPQS